ncbi:46017_t:CDS:2, partial [Gigaspora margarita]
TVNKLLRFTNDPEIQLVTFGYDDITDVFMKVNNKNTCERHLTSLRNIGTKSKSQTNATRTLALVYISNISEIASNARQKI